MGAQHQHKGIIRGVVVREAPYAVRPGPDLLNEALKTV